MTSPAISAVRLTDTGADSAEPKNVLIVGAGLGTGVRALWQPVADLLARDYQVIGWDLPGHDGAQPHHDELRIADLANGVAELVKSLRAHGTIHAQARVFYAGVSVNGQVALQLALDHAPLFDGIAVVCSAAKIGEPESWDERAKLVAEAGTPVLMEGSVQRWFSEGFVAANPTAATSLMHTLQNADRFSYARLCGALGTFDAREQLHKITVPIVTIHGADDVVCPPADGEFITGTVPTGTGYVVENTAHQIPMENPQRTAEILTQHFV